MPTTFKCLHCGKILPKNPRLKKIQKYCSAKRCQQARRSARKKKRYNSDPLYRKKHLEAQKAWRESRPAHQYQRKYRKSHPQYVKRNRELQRERNKNRYKEPEAMIVNGTSIAQVFSSSYIYPVKNLMHPGSAGSP